MKVKELIEKLQHEDAESNVLLSTPRSGSFYFSGIDQTNGLVELVVRKEDEEW